MFDEKKSMDDVMNKKIGGGGAPGGFGGLGGGEPSAPEGNPDVVGALQAAGINLSPDQISQIQAIVGSGAPKAPEGMGMGEEGGGLPPLPKL